VAALKSVLIQVLAPVQATASSQGSERFKRASTLDTCTQTMPDVLLLGDQQKYNIINIDYSLVEELAGLAQNRSVVAEVSEVFKAFEIPAWRSIVSYYELLEFCMVRAN